jgi:hypothetical protein
MKPAPPLLAVKPKLFAAGSSEKAWLKNAKPKTSGVLGSAQLQVAELPEPTTRFRISGSASSRQPGMPIASSGNGSGRLVEVTKFDRPTLTNAMPNGRCSTSAVNVVPSAGREPGAACSTGTPSVPAQPAPYCV